MSYREVDVSRDRAAAVEMVRRSGQQGVPVITVGDEVVVGFDQRRLESLISRPAGKVSLGISIADASRIAAKQGAIPVFGALVGKVVPSSPGSRAGLEPGDIITEANMRPVANASDLEAVLKGLQPGSRLLLVARRGEREYRAEVRF